MYRYKETLEMEKNIKNLGYHVISVWECEKPKMIKNLNRKTIHTLSLLYRLRFRGYA